MHFARRTCRRRRNRSLLLSQAAGVTSLVLLSAGAGSALAQYETPDPQWNPPAAYYNAAAGVSGNDLRNSLHTIISAGFRAQSYGDSRYNMATQYSDHTPKASP